MYTGVLLPVPPPPHLNFVHHLIKTQHSKALCFGDYLSLFLLRNDRGMKCLLIWARQVKMAQLTLLMGLMWVSFFTFHCLKRWNSSCSQNVVL